MDYLKFIELLASIVTIWGVVEISFVKRRGLVICMYAQLLWIYYAWCANMWFFLITSIVILIIDIIGYYTWTIKGVGYNA